jgi:hypothetical protein
VEIPVNMSESLIMEYLLDRVLEEDVEAELTESS